MKILVLTSCTSRKLFQAEHPLTWEDFQRGPAWVRKQEKGRQLIPAEEMYTGEQHTRLMRGVKTARNSGVPVDVWILSAGYGLIPGTRLITSYQSSFLKLTPKEIQQRANFLSIPEEMNVLLQRRDFDLKIILLGGQYLETFSIKEIYGPVLIVEQKFARGLVGLKGKVGAYLLAKVSNPTKKIGALNRVMLDTRHEEGRRYTFLEPALKDASFQIL